MANKPHLTNMPNEVLGLLPQHLESIEDLVSLSSSCSILKHALEYVHPNTILQLAANSALSLFEPSPQVLIALTARQVSDWALLNDENTQILRSAFRKGEEGLYILCLARAGLTLEAIRSFHDLYTSIIDPLTNHICQEEVKTLNTRDIKRSAYRKEDCLPAKHRHAHFRRALLQFATYGELFLSTAYAVLLGGLGLGLEAPLEYTSCCISINRYMDHGMVYVIRSSQGGVFYQMPKNSSDRSKLRDIFNGWSCGRLWPGSCRTVRMEIGEDFNEPWRQRCWISAIQMQGLEGLRLFKPPASPEMRSSLQQMYKSMSSKPSIRAFRIPVPDIAAFHATSEFPNLGEDLVCFSHARDVSKPGFWLRNRPVEDRFD